MILAVAVSMIHWYILQLPKWDSADLAKAEWAAYHGEEGFRTFTHYKSIVNKKTWPDLSIRYQPYTPKNEKKLRKFLK